MLRARWTLRRFGSGWRSRRDAGLRTTPGPSRAPSAWSQSSLARLGDAAPDDVLARSSRVVTHVDASPPGGEMQRLTGPQMREYWRIHDRRFGGIDYARDPDGLTNICGAGQPLWLSRHYARFQRVVFESLLASTPPPEEGMRALDVGCGAGRWCVVLARRGYRVVGIEIQETLVRDNRRRFPEMEFFEAPLEEFRSTEPFHLVSSVTVLQHVPFDVQQPAIARLRELTVTGGHALVLENVRYQAPDHFSRSAADWTSLFRTAGFELVASRPYNYSPALRLCARLRALLPGAPDNRRPVDRVDSVVAPPVAAQPAGSRFHRVLECGHRALLRSAVGIDSVVEPALMARKSPLAPTNFGFLFRAV